MNLFQRIFYRPFFIRLFNWEYWSFNTLYAPIVIVWFWLCLRARSFFFFAAANPSIKYGGFLMESKKDIYDIMPPELYPRTLLAETNIMADKLLDRLKEAGFTFPLIAKPDIGGRGRGVKKLQNENELVNYASNSELDFLVQEFADYPNETGIFFYRYPDMPDGIVSGIVGKAFLSVTGDGISSIRQLCKREPRFILQLKDLEAMYGKKLDIVLPAGERKELVPYGNHARGAKFTDDSHLIDADLGRTINDICGRIPGFYYGRLDIRYNTWEELKRGRNFSIIEVNGAGSEPTHIYDPKHTVFFAWKEIIRHWIILWKISRQLHKQGVPYLRFEEGLRMFRDNRNVDKILARQHV